jgi:E3 ubiquitin-protein ligase SHPRH
MEGEVASDSSLLAAVFLTEGAFDEDAILDGRENQQNSQMKSVLRWLLPVARESIPDGEDADTPNFEPSALYDIIKPPVSTEAPLPQPPELLPKLRNYQLRAASWMVGRERFVKKGTEIHPLWFEIKAR